MDTITVGQVTYAVRNTKIDGLDLKIGDIMGLDDKKILTKGKEIDEVVINLIDILRNREELITLYYDKEEVSVLQTELDSLRKQNEELETQISKQQDKLDENAQIIVEKDKQIQKLEEEKIELEKKTKATTTVKTVVSNTSFKADGNYSQATQVWNALRALGLNEYVCAGILGNIMSEVGGHTLDISRWSYYASTNTTYYGICQWAGSRKQRLLNNFGTTLEAQIRFLSVELFEVIPKGNSFYNMQDEKQAALYFAKYYERCSSKYYNVRQADATKALAYFTV
jgi:hypothetical protein